MKALNLTPDQRINVKVTYNVNRFEVYAASGFMMFAAGTKQELKDELTINGIASKNVTLDSAAIRMYRN